MDVRTQLTQLRGNLAYTQSALNSKLSEWERKEYTEQKEMLLQEIDRLEKYISENQAFFDRTPITP